MARRQGTVGEGHRPGEEKPFLVTGATGFIGRRLVDRLLREGVHVRAFVRSNGDGGFDSDDRRFPGDAGGQQRPPSLLEIVEGDVSVAGDVASAVEGCGTVVHLAAVVTDWGPPALYDAVTVRGTRNVLDAALAEGAKVVVVSSVTYYGDAVSRGVVCREDAPPGRPAGIYGRSKRRQEEEVRAFVARGGRAAIVRPTNVYGAGSGNWVDELAGVMRRGLPVLVGRGAARNNAGLVHVEDVVDVLVRAARDPRADGRAYNASPSDDVTWERYMTDLARISGAPRPRSIPLWLAKIVAFVMEAAWTLFRIQSSRPPFTFEALNLVGSDFRVPNTRAVEELGHKSRMTYAEGIREVMEYLEEVREKTEKDDPKKKLQ